MTVAGRVWRAVFVLVALNHVVSNAAENSFSKDVLPLLSDRCFQCHGPDEANREAGLRLDSPSIVGTPGQKHGIVVPGSLDASELWSRIVSDDPDTMMPPTGAHRAEWSDSELGTIREWILSGADWGRHWSFTPIARPKVSQSESDAIDWLINQRLKELGFRCNALADSRTRLRRLSFSLRGVGPTVQETEQLVPLIDAGGFSEVVDRFLEDSLHAERLAMWWLDAARYSDSDGYQQDLTRENWPWRDWVINAFRSNMRFDQFTREQFAGDLMKNATPEQILATCFHRNHMTNGEGGRDPEESRVDYVLDRTNTMGTVWLGLTLGCTQCHSHKFDPISQRDYYSLTAFFNSIDEDGKAGKNAKPYLSYQSPFVNDRINKTQLLVEECEKDEKRRLQVATQRFDGWLQEMEVTIGDNYTAWLNPKIESVISSEGTEFSFDDSAIVQTLGPTPQQDDYRIEFSLPAGLRRIAGWRIEVFPEPSHVNGMFTRDGNGDFILTNVKTLIRQSGNPNEVELENESAIADYEAKKDRQTKWDTRYSNIKETLNDDARDGWTTEGAESVTSHLGVYKLKQPYEIQEGDRLVVILKQRSTLGEANIGRFRISITSERGETLKRFDSVSPLTELSSLANAESSETPDELRERLFQQFLLDQKDYQQATRTLALAKSQLNSLKTQAKPRSVMVLKDREEPRQTHVLIRGVWDQKGDLVEQGFLTSIIGGAMTSPANRLDLANWLVSRENPLTARVTVNHLWRLMFGRGLVSTAEDFGLQGEQPTHPMLLDWLAAELMDTDWDLRHILRLIANSQAFQRSSVMTDELKEVDPGNRWLARGPRHRLDAWMLRDNALRASGLLDESIGGPPVYPYQPPGVWSEITMGRFQYEPSLGAEQYRRTIYAFWRRSSAPTFLFDSAQRRVCEVDRGQTNTPLQALTLLNDETYLESSRVIADRLSIINDFDSAVQTLAMIVLSREWKKAEIESIRTVYNSSREYYQRNPLEAQQYIDVGQQTQCKVDSAPEIAAWMTCVSLTLNLDEAISLE